MEQILEHTRKSDQGIQHRSTTFERSEVNVEARTVELAFSSEEPYQRWWGTEVLDHQPAAVRLGRMNDGRHPLLVDHSTRDQVGVIERAWIGDDRKGRALVRFGKSARADEIFQDVRDGIRSLVSVGYRIHNMVLQSSGDDGDTYRVDDWEPFECSIVAVPADPTVGVGRENEEDLHLRTLINKARKETQMEKNEELVVLDKPTPKIEVVDQAKERKAGADQERQRVREITALAEQFDKRELATAAIEAGTSYDAFREIVFTKLQESGKLKLADTGKLGLSDKEVRNFRFTNIIAATMFPNDESVRKMAGFELEVCRAAADQRENVKVDRQGAFCIPVDVLTQPQDLRMADAEIATRLLMNKLTRNGLVGQQQRDLNVTTATAGGNLVATELLGSSFIDLLTNAMVLSSMGVTVLNDLQGNVAIPRATGGTTGYWVAENTASTESQPAFDQVSMTPKTAGAFTDYSRRLLLQSSVAVEAFVRMDIARTIALMGDLAGINGSGASNQPRGVMQTSGIGSVAGGTNGLAPTWDNIVDLESQVANANAAFGSLAYLTNTKVRGKLKRTQKFSGTNGQEIWGGELNGNRAFVSNQVPSNLTKGSSSGVCSAILFGNWADLVLGFWGGLDILVDPYSGGTAGTKRVIALQDMDVAVRQPVSFAAMLDALTV